MEITPAQFVEKYKLIPKQLRFKLLESVAAQFFIVYDEWNQDIFDDTMNMLRWYENTNEENFTLLTSTLQDEVYLGETFVYLDIAKSLLNHLNWYSHMTFFTSEYVERDQRCGCIQTW